MYILSILTQSNYHIHTRFSTCASTQMTVQNILVQANNAGLKRIALVDHDHDIGEGILDHVSLLKNQLKQTQSSIEVIVGAELSAYGVDKYSISKDVSDQIDFRLYSTNHYHLDHWEHPQSKTPRAYAEHTLDILEQLIKAGRADCIAHPFIGIYLRDVLSDYKELTRTISDRELGDVLELGKAHNVAWELNTNAIYVDPLFAKRLWQIGREIEVKFLFGTDAHQLDEIEEPAVLALKVESMLKK